MEDIGTSAARAVSTVFEIVAIAIIILGFVNSCVRGARIYLSTRDGARAYRALHGVFGRGVLLGLEVLVAADIIRTVAVDPTIEAVAALGLLVLVRTFLSWSLEVDIEGSWPWQRRRLEDAERLQGLTDED